MSFARDYYDGEKAIPVGKPIVTDGEMLRTRDREFYVHHLMGWTYEQIGRKYRISRQYACLRVNRMPEAEKARIRRMNLVPSVA